EEVARGVVSDGGEQAVAGLLELAAGYDPVAADEDHPLVARVDALPGLTRVGGPQDQVLWRMSDNEAARVRVLDADGDLVSRVPSEGPHGTAAGRVEDAPEGSTLHVAEGAGWSGVARVAVDGE